MRPGIRTRPPAIDDAGVAFERRFRRLDRTNRLAVDHNPQAPQERVRLAVEQKRVRERDAVHRGRAHAGGRAPRSGGERARHGGRRDKRKFPCEMRIEPRKGRRVAEAKALRRPRRCIIRRALKHSGALG
jgi:hypothetical protein